MRNIVIFIWLIFVPIASFSQRWKLSRSEIIGGVGVSNYFGDLGGAIKDNAPEIQDVDIQYSRPNIFIGYRYRLYDRVAVKGQVTYARLYGSDIGSKNEARNFAFSANLIEVYGHFEYHITEEKHKVSYKSMSVRGKLQKLNAGLNFYIFAGIGGAYNKVIPLDNFSSSSRFEEKTTALVFPFGVGIKYPLTLRTYIGFEMGRRFTTSDLIDGYSPEQSEHKDVYYFTVINVTYKIKKRSKRRPEYRF